MKKIFLAISFLLAGYNMVLAQETVYPAPAQTSVIFLKNATLHLGNGTVIENGVIGFSQGKIIAVGANAPIPAAIKVYDLQGQHVYPGIIAPNTNLGLVEVEAVRATDDATEVGELNPSVRAIVSYNTDSKVINTLRVNGILLANIVPEGGLLSGSSSVVQLDGWNWEDAAYKTDNGLHVYLPRLLVRSNPFGPGAGLGNDVIKSSLDRIEKLKVFFREAKAYLAEPKHTATNLKFESTRRLFSKDEKLFIHCELVKEMLIATQFADEFGFDVVIVGGTDAWQIADILHQKNIAVIVNQPHSLPLSQDDDVDQPYKTPAQLQKAGVLFCIGNEGFWQQRNLMFNAGTAAAYGLGKEEALRAITLNAAKILGIDKVTGSLEVGKDANIVVSTGDILDMRTNNITQAFIQGREISLDNKQKQLYERYKYKYGIK
ncbi:Imidazolonepropionase [Chitinophaga costaii]|uniref:Imidazolonepropionase n=1 Tax=Chitinophaga costaii TaxID=1335309 RepID=A0A1C4G1I8_9BACT|nr:amidohydrolase family protein [Chitinophaga costaii]PUZ19931.1 amidohydrolase [Chitinophaga costaii]SCC62016.1 Imidazolonepropionase [Chitinophaga costaii]